MKLLPLRGIVMGLSLTAAATSLLAQTPALPSAPSAVTICCEATPMRVATSPAIAASSLATEWLKGKTVDEAGELKNTAIVQELSLPPV